MTIIEALKNKDYSLRISCGHRWLIWRAIENEWQVWEHKPYKRNTQLVISTSDESEAVLKLIED